MNIFKLSKISFFTLILFAIFSCEEDLQEFDLVSIEPCDNTNVVEDPLIISDFECQDNVSIEDVSTVRNPTETTINTSLFVGEFVDGSSPTDGFTINYGSAIDLAENGVFKFKLNSQITGELVVKLQNNGSEEIELAEQVFGGDAWQQQEFDFSDFEDFSFNQISIIFNNGVQTDGEDVYYIDDLLFEPAIDPCENVQENPTIISDFECQQNYFLGNPNQGETVVPIVENPTFSGINTSEFVGEYTDDGTAPFDNLLIDFGAPIDLSDNAQFNIKVYSSMEAPVIARLEGGNVEVEREVTIDETNEWIELTFDFTEAQGEGNTQLYLFFNAGNNDGSAEDIYYIDDLRFVPFEPGCDEIVEDCTGVQPDLTVLNDFDCQQNFPFVDAASIPTVQNPSISCVNRSSNVGEYTDNGTDPFDNASIVFNDPIDLSVNNQLKIKVLATEAGPFLAKLEGGNNVEVYAQISELNEWKEYTFDFSGAEGEGNTKLVLFFNATEVDGTTEDTYYIDDLRFEAQ